MLILFMMGECGLALLVTIYGMEEDIIIDERKFLDTEEDFSRYAQYSHKP